MMDTLQLEITNTKYSVEVEYVRQLPTNRHAIAEARWSWKKLGFDFKITIDKDSDERRWLAHEIQHCRQVIRNPFQGWFYKNFDSFKYRYELVAYAAQLLSFKEIRKTKENELIEEYVGYIVNDYSLNVYPVKVRKDLVKKITKMRNCK